MVSRRAYLCDFSSQKIDAEMRLYDQQEKTEDRKDFLAQLRVKDDPSRLHYKRDMLNHLSNNV